MGKVIFRSHAPTMREFHCEPCNGWFKAFTMRKTKDSEEYAPSACPKCGVLAEERYRVPPPGTRIAIRGGESNSVPHDVRKLWQKYWNLTDNDMKHVTREGIDRDMKARGLDFVDASWDDNANGSRRQAGQAVELPPETDDPNEVRDYNAKRYGREAVVDLEDQIRSEYQQGLAAESAGADYKPLPRAEDVDVHDTPHIIDVDKTIETIAAAPVVDKGRKQELQGRLVTGS